MDELVLTWRGQDKYISFSGGITKLRKVLVKARPAAEPATVWQAAMAAVHLILWMEMYERTQS